MSAIDLFKSRNSDLGIVWIFATLGRQSKVRSLSKKAIASVDIQAACQVLVSPEQQLSLRVSSQLMTGLARVYVSQAESWINDVTAMHTSVRRMAMSTSFATTDAIDLPKRSRTVRKDTITLKLSELSEGLFEFERVVDVSAQAATGAAAPGIGTGQGLTHKHTVSQDKITLPSPTVSLLDEADAQGDSLLFGDSDLGAGLMGWDPNQDQAGLDLGLFADDGDFSLGGEATSAWALDASNSFSNSIEPLVAPLLSVGDLTTSKDDRFDERLNMMNDNLPPLDDDGPNPGNISWPEHDIMKLHVGTNAGAGEKQDENLGGLEATWEDPNPVRRQYKRRRLMAQAKQAQGPMVDLRIEVDEVDLLRWGSQYAQTMEHLTHVSQSKTVERLAMAQAQSYLDGMFDLPVQNQSVIATFWDDMLDQAKYNCQKKNQLVHPAGGKKRPRIAGERYDCQGQAGPESALGMGLGGNDDLPPLNGMPPLGGISALGDMQPITGWDDMPPLDEAPLIALGGDASGFSTSDMGVGRDSGSTAGSRRELLPWNMPSMFMRFGSEVPGSMSGTPRQSGQPMLWLNSNSQPSPLPQPGAESLLTNEYNQEGEAWGNKDGMDNGDPAVPMAAAKAQQAHWASVEEDNFAKYVLAVARSLPAGAPAPGQTGKTRSLFFSDVAPVAEASTSVAAQAFYHILALVTARKMSVRQHEPYAELVMTLPDPTMPLSQTSSPVFRGAGPAQPSPRTRIPTQARSHSQSGSHYTSGSGHRRTLSRDASMSAYLSLPSPSAAI